MTMDTEDSNIWTAASDGKLTEVQNYVANGVSVNAQDEYGYSPLHAAASYGQVETLKWLLENGGNVALKDADGDTPLHYCEDAECADLLLQHGASLFVENDNGYPPYYFSVWEDREEMREWFENQYRRTDTILPEVPANPDGEEEMVEVNVEFINADEDPENITNL